MRRRRQEGQAMVEFALVLPLLMAIVMLVIATSLVYAVREAEHKVAYDAARHIAKKDHTSFTACGSIDNGVDDAMVEEVIAYYYDGDHSSALLKAFSTRPIVRDVTSGPELPGFGEPKEFFCNQAVGVTLEYDISVPGWDYLARLYGAGAGGTSHLQERAFAARVDNNL